MSVRAPRTSVLGALVALVAGLIVLPASSAGAATGQLLFSCTGPGFGTEPFYPFTAVVDTDLPPTLPYGAARTTTWTTTVVAPDSFRSWAHGQGFTTLHAGVNTTAALDGAPQASVNQASSAMPVPSTAGAWTWILKSTTNTNTQVPAASSGQHSFTFTKLDLTVAFQKGDVNAYLTSASCVLDPATPTADALIDTYDVVAAPTTTALALKGDMATATVSSAGAAPSGIVTFSVAGTSVASEVKGGKASVKLSSVPPGTHTVSASFAPSNASQFAGSTGTATYAAPRIATTTAATAVLRPTRRLLKAKASVSAKDRSTVSGRVTFVLKRNGRTIANSTATLFSRGGAAKKFRKVRKTGRYTVVAKYLGTSTYEGSQDRVRLP